MGELTSLVISMLMFAAVLWRAIEAAFRLGRLHYKLDQLQKDILAMGLELEHRK